MELFHTHITHHARMFVDKVLGSGRLSEGVMVADFEHALSDQLGVCNPVATNSGTSALHLALLAAGVGPDDQVIIPSMTFVATAAAVHYCRAIPVVVDICPETGNMDPMKLKGSITDRTKAIIPVHWMGMPCDMEQIHQAAYWNDLTVIEDAAQAVGATYHDAPIGSISQFTCFSFQATKQLTSGDGGAVCCTYEKDATKVRRLRWFGFDRNSPFTGPHYPRQMADGMTLGYKYHMNDLAAAVGMGNLAGIHDRLKRRREVASEYYAAFYGRSDLKTLPRTDEPRESAYYAFTVLVEETGSFISAMNERGVPAAVTMGRVDHMRVATKKLGVSLSGTEFFNPRHVELPCHEALTDKDVSQVIDAVRKGW